MSSILAETHVHPTIRKLAKEFAGAWFEGDRSPRFRANFPSPRGDMGARTYVRLNWPHFVKQARAVLTEMLTQPGRSDDEKAEIYELLLADVSHNTTALPPMTVN